MIHRGGVYDAQLARVGVRPVVVVTRERAIPVLSSVAAVPVTSTVRGHPAEVTLGPEQGLKHECVANCDNVTNVEKGDLVRYRGSLGPQELARLDDALRIALQLD